VGFLFAILRRVLVHGVGELKIAIDMAGIGCFPDRGRSGSPAALIFEDVGALEWAVTGGFHLGQQRAGVVFGKFRSLRSCATTLQFFSNVDVA